MSFFIVDPARRKVKVHVTIIQAVNSSLPFDLQCRLLCESCRNVIWLPQGILGHLGIGPTQNSIQAPAIAVPCHQCKHIQMLLKTGFRAGQMKAEYPAMATRFYGWTGGGKATCEFRIPLYQQMSPTDAEKEWNADVSTWKWGGAACPDGHPLIKI